MKYGIWRHENALGNSAEQVVNLGNFIQEKKDMNPVIYVETEFQKDFSLCIPGVKEENIHFFDKNLDLAHLNEIAKEHNFFKDILYATCLFFLFTISLSICLV